MIDSDKKPFGCHFCHKKLARKKFKTKDPLAAHRKVHSDARNFPYEYSPSHAYPPSLDSERASPYKYSGMPNETFGTKACYTSA